jgi:SNF2 family DNA or RNA helicase
MKFALYPYQQEAFDAFMARGNLLLALDTGLGKTATAIAIAEDLLERRKVRRVLLVVPANLKLQWARSLAKFTDLPATEIRVKGEKLAIPDPSSCVIIDGTPEAREKQYARARARSVEYVITGYDQVVSDYRRIKQLGCDLVILDEASAIKTPAAQRSKAVKKHLKVPYRLALTATPIENRPEEVFSIMKWVDEEVLGRYDLFDKAYIVRNAWGAVQQYKNLDVLHDKLSTAMVRKTRLDPEVAPYMPDVTTEVWRVGMDDQTHAAYLSMATDLLAAYEEVGPMSGTFSVDAHYTGVQGDRRGDKSGLGKLMSVHGCMEMLLAHPTLLAQSANNYLTTDDRGSRYAADLLLAAFPLPPTSPKLDFLVERATEILHEDPQAKLLVFTWYKGMLPLMAQRFRDIGFDVTTYDGDMSVREKEASVSRFATDPKIRIFLSSHAGAYGVDMPFANWLINYDIPWGAGKAAQINGRHVRASSEFDVVHVRDIVVAGSIEERKLATKRQKGALSEGVIDGKGGRAEISNEVETLKSHATQLVDAA